MLKCLLSLLCCCAAVWSVPSAAPRYDLALANQLFEEFVRTHQRQYESEHERQMRFDIFKDNLENINKQNMKSKTAVFAVNKFADLTPEEFLQKYTGLGYAHVDDDDDDDDDDEHCLNTVKIEIPLNKSFDWRDYNKVTRVKDQLTCGSCWAFSTVAQLESKYAIQYGELKEFSEQQLVDCDDDDYGCGGGYMERAFLWLKNNGGLESQEDYPYTSEEEICKFDETKVHLTVNNCVRPYIDEKNETQLAMNLVIYGPLTIGVDASVFQFYDGGILDICDGLGLNHGVLLVGYGEEDNTPYWTIKNSWGKSFGEDGYIRILRNKNCCSVTQYVLSGLIN